GSAGWMLRVALESVLGLTLEGGDTLVLRPRIPDEWPGFRVRYRLPDGRTVYEIEVARGGEDGTVRIPLVRDGGMHRVRISLGSHTEDTEDTEVRSP
ncbi:MAG TPA: hypothetical protein VFX98_00365, partial [Longimicrobiaceae bacterium]|nr:hypothetical protein [Longimicrobiaceae bacterium]